MRRPADQSKSAPTRPASLARARPRLPAWLMAGLLVLGTMALYWPATRCDFVNYDDDVYVSANVQVQNGTDLGKHKMGVLEPGVLQLAPLNGVVPHGGLSVCGLKPWGHHLTNVLLHALNAGLVFALLQQMTGARWRSLLVAALFAFHPLRVESVAWVSERKDVLSGFFGLLALMAYARYAEGEVSSAEVKRSPWSVVSGPRADDHAFHVFPLPLPLLSSFPVLVRPGLDEQADAGDVAVRDVAAGLLAAGDAALQNPPCATQPATPSITQHASTLATLLFVEKDPVLCPRGGGERRDLRGAAARRRFDGAESLPLGARVGNALISYCRYLGSCSGRRIWRFSIRTPGIGRWGRCCWRVG